MGDLTTTMAIDVEGDVRNGERGAGRRGRVLCVVITGALVVSLLLPSPAEATLCPDVAHDSDPVALDCTSTNERWAVIDASTGLVTNVVGWNGTNLWRPEAGQFARDLPDGASVGPGWWYVDGSFVRDSFERNVTARADILSVHLSWSSGGLGTDSSGITFTVDVQPTGQRFSVNDSQLTIDPLDADVLHTFTVIAIRPDGTTVLGPIVTATPQRDPDPDCTNIGVARECRAATGWAVVHPESGMVENVIVCTPWQCGTDGEWGGLMPSDTSWPRYRLIELTGPGGIGWQYIDGRFVDVRPIEEPELPTEQPEPASGATESRKGAGATEDRPLDSTEGEDGADGPTEGSAPGTASADGTEPAADDALDATEDTSSDDASVRTGTVTDDTTEVDPADTSEVLPAGAADIGAIRRAFIAVVSFLRGLFGN